LGSLFAPTLSDENPTTWIYSSSALKNEGPSSNILKEEVRPWRHAYFLLEGDVRMQERKDKKERLLDHLRNNTCILLEGFTAGLNCDWLTFIFYSCSSVVSLDTSESSLDNSEYSCFTR
jgi:hypothetical protein